MGKEKSKKRKRSAESSEDSSSSSSTDCTREKKKLRKLKKKLRKEQKKTEKALQKKLKKEKKKLKKKRRSKSSSCSRDDAFKKGADEAADIPLELMEKSKAMAPMTKEEWEKRQSIVRRVLDEESGRYRLIKGDGEVLEEIVSRDRHKQINRQATQADGAFFQAQTVYKH
ncbi:ADP-ribosylation factor-like protein 6-interacting protein 4 [Hyposmocoma kahamanoa]|uniref:ADP-ribosylation factor-like protein 6-interacting protein 4 n=1 Tax=Hyposmocoma kahamanoa TaxID=1477025 RepID=UPI000E6D8DE5|nr:ADP-ribosylation factor-like protein 6-interacting protein 4 [Hyposmocoma kahamanoa]